MADADKAKPRNPRPEATCQQQITRLPPWRPGDFVIVGNVVARVETLTCWVTPGDEVGVWMVGLGDDDPILLPVIERWATPEEIAASGPWAEQADTSFLAAQILITMQQMALKSELLHLGNLWFENQAEYVAALRAEIARAEAVVSIMPPTPQRKARQSGCAIDLIRAELNAMELWPIYPGQPFPREAYQTIAARTGFALSTVTTQVSLIRQACYRDREKAQPAGETTRWQRLEISSQ